MLQGVTSLWVEATPTKGWSMSLSESPMARIMERWGARIAPSVVSHERHLPGARLDARLAARLPGLPAGRSAVVMGGGLSLPGRAAILGSWLMLCDRLYRS